jgi:hypothetical protein
MLELLAQIATNTFPDLPPILCKDLDFLTCVFSIFRQILSIVSVLAVSFASLMFAWAGFLYMSKPEKSSEIHKRILWGAVGLVIALLSYAIVLLITNLISFNSIFVFAEELPSFSPPEKITCGGIEIPSVFETSTLPQNAWSVCFFYLLFLFLSYLYKAAFLATAIMLIWTGFNYMAKPEKSSEIHKNFIYIAIGILISFSSFTVVKLIERFFFSLR